MAAPITGKYNTIIGYGATLPQSNSWFTTVINNGTPPTVLDGILPTLALTPACTLGSILLGLA